MFKTIMDYLKSNKAAAGMFLGAMLLVGSAAAMQGCSLGDIIKHKVPPGMQEYNHGEPKVSINDAPFVLEDYVAEAERNVRQFTEANDRAHLVFDGINSMLTIGLEEFGSSPIPGAGIAATMMVGLGGLMTRKPGTAREIANEKMASFNKGQEIALAQAQKVLTPEMMRALLEKIKES